MNKSSDHIPETVKQSDFRDRLRAHAFPFFPLETGVVTSIMSGIVTVSGLREVWYEEILEFPGGLRGMAYNLDEHEIGVILLGDETHLKTGDVVKRTGRVMDIPAGEDFLGRVINPLGDPVDGKGAIAARVRRPIERIAPAIMDREPVNRPLQTGIKVVDALIPVGKGQRELILGDRQTGKTAIAVDTIISQKGQNVVCIYCAIGQRAASVARVISSLSEAGSMEYTTVLVAEGNHHAGLKYIAPYAATSLAEYFMEKGMDVLIVYDDLTHHARAYRELSLLLRRPPGREAFPGDIFYIHSRLLERSTQLNRAKGGGSLTALPIVQTEAQNIAAYIPTNLISITDGQIYLSPRLFELGVLPAIDVGMSVSRIGGKAQLPAYRSVSGGLKLAYAQFEELENYARFGTRIDEHSMKTIEYGKRIRAWVTQPELRPIPVAAQVILLHALSGKLFDYIDIARFHEAESALLRKADDINAEIMEAILSGKLLSEAQKEELTRMAEEDLRPFGNYTGQTDGESEQN